MDRDEGLQGERTALSWRRTGLALLVGSLVLGRLTLERSGPVAVVVIGIAAVVVLWAMVDAFRHGRMALVSPVDERFSSLLRDGRLPRSEERRVGKGWRARWSREHGSRRRLVA